MKNILKRYAMALFFLVLVIVLMLFGTLGVMSLGDEMAHEMGVDMKPKGERLLK